MPGAPELKQFRTERSPNGVLHLVFDMPGRSMNVFSNAAIEELGRFADWLPQSDVAGVVIRSGKASAFCAGADLAELETAYDMIMAAPAAERDRVAFDHFFRLSQGLRKLETAGKPVAVAIAGLALGGGAEFALAEQARRKYLRVVQDQAVSGADEFRELAELPVLPLPARPVDKEHPRRGPIRQRILCDQLLRQVVVEVANQHDG